MIKQKADKEYCQWTIFISVHNMASIGSETEEPCFQLCVRLIKCQLGQVFTRIAFGPKYQINEQTSADGVSLAWSGARPEPKKPDCPNNIPSTFVIKK